MAALGPLTQGLGNAIGGLFGLDANEDATNEKLQGINAAKGDVASGYGAATSLYQPLVNKSMGQYTSLADKYNAGGFKNPTYTPYQGNTFDPNNLSSNPTFQALLKQGQDAITSSAAAKGSLFGGNTARALQDYGIRTASTEANNLFNQNMAQNEFGAQQAQQAYANNAANNATQFNEGESLTGELNPALGGLASLQTGGASELGNLDLGIGNTGAQGALNRGQLMGGIAQNAGNTANATIGGDQDDLGQLLKMAALA